MLNMDPISMVNVGKLWRYLNKGILEPGSRIQAMPRTANKDLKLAKIHLLLFDCSCTYLSYPYLRRGVVRALRNTKEEVDGIPN